MPGSQKIILTDKSKMVPRDIEITTRPTSLWRLVPGLGPLVMFRLGASASFRMDFKLLSEGVEDREEDGSLDVSLLIQGNLTRQGISFPYPQEGRNTFVCTEGFFLNGLGHSQLTITNVPETSYTFDIWEPAYAIVNWGMVLLAGGLGGLVGFLLALIAGTGNSAK